MWAGGRAGVLTGEFAMTSYATAVFDLDFSMLFYRFIDAKNSKGELSCATSDFDNVNMCWLHSLFCIMLLTPGRSSNFLCESLASKSSNALVKWMNETFSICMSKNVPGVTDRHSGTSLRIGSINVMTASPHVTLYESIARSGHSIKGECRIFEYANGDEATLAVSARELAGWPAPRMLNYPARLHHLKEYLLLNGLPSLTLDGPSAVQLLENFVLSFITAQEEVGLINLLK